MAFRNPNPFCSESLQAEYRLRAARPELLGDEAIDARTMEQADANACQVPSNDDTSIEDDHLPYDMEPVNPGGTSVRHTAGGDMP